MALVPSRSFSTALMNRLRPKPLQRTRVVVLGSGWGGFNFLKNIDTHLYDVRCVSPANHFLFTPLLPSCAVGTLEFRAIQEPVRTVKGLAGYYQAKAIAVDPKKREVTCKDVFEGHQFTLPYDYLVITCGSKTGTFNTPGIDSQEGHNVHFLKHLYHARQVRNRILECFERAAIHTLDPSERDRLLTFIVVGGGPTSCEFVGELYDFITEDITRWYPDLRKHARVLLVEAGSQLLSTFDKQLAEYVVHRFRARAIDIRLGVSVKEVRQNTCVLSDGTEIPFGMMVWSAGLQPVKLVKGLGAPCGPTGRILTDNKLQVEGWERVYAMGDCAVVHELPLPPIAQAAMQQAVYLSKVFNASAPGGPLAEGAPTPKPFEFRSLGSMAMLGGWRAVADFTHVGPKDRPRNVGKATGRSAFLLWRTAYWGKQVSFVNKILIPMYWFKAWLFGRDISRF
eukprot:Sspe_Gene.103009::Locus_78861_Transcript_1_1_Confidence_1.000_Length_1455::g.103009::m.103009/K17871/ndh1; NADH:ubiquinone reductase (non-electrogenic)